MSDPRDTAATPAWKTALRSLLENHATNGGVFTLVALGNFLLLYVIFDVRHMTALTAELSGALVAAACLLAFAELVLFERWLGGGAFMFELKTGLGKAFVAGWAVLLIASLAYAVNERTGAADERDRKHQAADERQREERREMFRGAQGPSATTPEGDSGQTPAERLRQLKAAMAQRTTRPTTGPATTATSRPATRPAK